MTVEEEFAQNLKQQSFTIRLRNLDYEPLVLVISIALFVFLDSHPFAAAFLSIHLVLFLWLGRITTAALYLWHYITYYGLFLVNSRVSLALTSTGNNTNVFLFLIWIVNVVFIFRWALAISRWSLERIYSPIMGYMVFLFNIVGSVYLVSEGNARIWPVITSNILLASWIKIHTFQIERIEWNRWMLDGVMFCRVNGKHLRIGQIVVE